MWRPTILLVDDIPIFRDLVILSLSSYGRIITAADDERALARVQAEPPSLVVAPYPPPDIGKVSICESLKQNPALAHVPVILLTPGAQPAQHAAAVRLGADDVLTKPLDRMTLLAAARRLLADHAVRGLPRVEVETPVRIGCGGSEAWGVGRNLSRGGIFVEAEYAYPPHTEVQLEFPLPGRREVMTPVGTVVWVSIPTGQRARGMGLRFLGLDASSARSLENFVYELRGPSLPEVRRMEVAR